MEGGRLHSHLCARVVAVCHNSSAESEPVQSGVKQSDGSGCAGSAHRSSLLCTSALMCACLSPVTLCAAAPSSCVHDDMFICILPFSHLSPLSLHRRLFRAEEAEGESVLPQFLPFVKLTPRSG